MKAIAIDLGDKRCGLAYNTESFVFPLPYIERQKLTTHLKKLIQERQIDTIVLGLPYDLYGAKTKQLNKSHVFFQKLKDYFPKLNVVGVDERFTTFQALQTLQSLNASAGEVEAQKDSLSACMILETYLSQK